MAAFVQSEFHQSKYLKVEPFYKPISRIIIYSHEEFNNF